MLIVPKGLPLSHELWKSQTEYAAQSHKAGDVHTNGRQNGECADNNNHNPQGSTDKRGN